MNYKKIVVIVFVIFSVLPIYKTFAASTNAGFIPANIWYSKDPFEEGDKIKIYTLIFNPDTRELSGTVVFYDKTILLGQKNFIVGAKGVKDISIDWTVTVGDHTIFAKIENAKFLISAGKYENIVLTENQTKESSTTVNKKIIPQAPDNSKISTDTSQIQNVQNLIKENTPGFISEPIVLAVNTVEGIRKDIGATSENNKEKMKSDINIINTDKSSPKAQSGANQLEKPIKYIELFFFSVLSFVFNNKLIFYGILIVLFLFIIRFLWRLIF